MALGRCIRYLATDARNKNNAAKDIALKNHARLGKKNRNRKKIIQELHGQVTIKDYPTILKDSKKRYREFYLNTSEIWARKILKDLSKEGITVSEPVRTSLKQELKLKSFDITAMSIFEPLDIGDAVELSSSLNQSGLAVVVQVPSSDDDPRYTIMNKLGELSYLEKSAIKFRIPRLIPAKWIRNIVYQVEDKNADHGSIKTTSDGFERYAVNPLARLIIVKPLVEVTNKAWWNLQENTRKLELTHRLLQTDGPREVSLFTLVKAVNLINLDEAKEIFEREPNIEKAYQELSQKLVESSGSEFTYKHGELTLGKEFENLDENELFNVSTFYSVVLALRKQKRLWTSTYWSRSTLVPLSVTVLPLHYAHKIKIIIAAVKDDPTMSSTFHSFIKRGDFSNIPRLLQPVFYLLKEYAVGNVEDAKLVTLVCQLMKPHTEKEINKSIVYDLLTKTRYIKEDPSNPLHFSTSLCLPDKGVSNKASLEQLFLDSNDVSNERATDLAKSRVDYSDLRVYCIDSETAHEVDDGVSLKKIDEDNYMLYIHVADPASYMTKDSTLTKIAYERASTIYQPELFSPMLPRSMAQLAGLGNDHIKTRALTFSVPYNLKRNQINFSESKIEATYLSRFPKYTYKDVDAVLQQNRLSRSAISNNEHQDLQDLFEVSKQLRNGRVENGAVIFGQSINPQVKVTPAVNMDNVDSGVTDVEVIFDKQMETDSVILVSELMILGNRIAAHFLSRNNIGGIYKGMEKLTLSENSVTLVENISKRTQQTSKLPTISEIVQAFKFIIPAYYSAQPKKHLMLGVDQYAPSTSPLRRFGDLINHFNIHHFLNNDEQLFTKGEILAISLHMEAKNDILKRASRQSSAFYAIKDLEENLNQELGDFIVTTKPLKGTVFGILRKYGVSCRMRLLDHKKPPEIGDLLKNYETLEFDKVGGTVSLKQI